MCIYIYTGVFIVGAKRTPFGAFGGALAKKTPTDLQTVAANAAIAQAGLDAKHIDSVVVGNVISVSIYSLNNIFMESLEIDFKF